MSSEIASIYIPYANISDDRKKPNDKQVTRGYIDNKDKLAFSAWPIAKIPNGRSHTIDAGKATNAKSTVKFYSLPNSGGVGSAHIVTKYVEFVQLLTELGWDEHEKKLMAKFCVETERLAKLQANVKNKTNDEGSSLSSNAIKQHKLEMAKMEKSIAGIRDSIADNTDRAGRLLSKLMGAYQNKLENIMEEHMSSDTTKNAWETVKVPCCKDPTNPNKVMYPLLPFDGEVNEDEDDTNEYKMCYMAKLHDVSVDAKEWRDLDAMELIYNKFLVNLHGHGLAEIQRSYLEHNLRFPTSLVFSCKDWTDMIMSINNYLPYLTTYKDHENYKDNPDIPRANVKLSEVELCKIILTSMPNAVRDDLRIQDPTRLVETDLHALVTRIDAILTKMRANNATKQEKQKNAPSTSTNSNKKKKTNSNGGGGGGGSNKPYSPENPKDGGCSNCQKNGKKAWYTHGTQPCRIYEIDGTLKKGQPQGGKHRGVRDHQKDENYEESLLQRLEDRMESRRRRERDHYRHDRRESRSRSRSRSYSPPRRSRSRRRDDRY